MIGSSTSLGKFGIALTWFCTSVRTRLTSGLQRLDDHRAGAPVDVDVIFSTPVTLATALR